MPFCTQILHISVFFVKNKRAVLKSNLAVCPTAQLQCFLASAFNLCLVSAVEIITGQQFPITDALSVIRLVVELTSVEILAAVCTLHVTLLQ